MIYNVNLETRTGDCENSYADERHKTLMEKDITTKFIKLIAEYPTWQEAVNSKEFNNG